MEDRKLVSEIIEFDYVFKGNWNKSCYISKNLDAVICWWFENCICLCNKSKTVVYVGKKVVDTYIILDG